MNGAEGEVGAHQHAEETQHSRGVHDGRMETRDNGSDPSSQWSQL
jgi:hypothetical protein